MVEKETFVVSVNYDDPRWREIKHEVYTYVNPDLKSDHLPISGHGTSEVFMKYVIFDYEPTTLEVLDEIKKRGLCNPDRAEAESFLDKYPEEQQKFSVIGLCGSVVGKKDDRYVAYVYADRGKRNLNLIWLDAPYLDQRCRFLAVRLSSPKSVRKSVGDGTSCANCGKALSSMAERVSKGLGAKVLCKRCSSGIPRR